MIAEIVETAARCGFHTEKPPRWQRYYPKVGLIEIFVLGPAAVDAGHMRRRPPAVSGTLSLGRDADRVRPVEAQFDHSDILARDLGAT